MSETAFGFDGRFDDDEVTRILARAAALDATESALSATAPVAPGRLPSDAGPAGGLSLRDLEAIGGEAGFAASTMRRAALDVLLERVAPLTEASTPSGLVMRRRLPLDRQPDEEAWARMVALLRDATGQVGTSTSDGLLRSWECTGLDAQLAPDPNGAGWLLTLEAAVADQSPAIGGFLVVAGLGSSAALGLIVGPRAMLLGALIAGVGAAIALLGRAWRQRWLGEQRLRLSSVASALLARGDVLAMQPER